MQRARNGATGPFGEGGGGAEEVEVEEPEFLAGLVPGIPAEHADAERRGELHVGGGPAGEADDGDAGDGDESGVEMASGAEPPHVQEDEDDEGERGGGGGKTGGPVGDAELLEEAHGAPVVEGGLFEPGLAVEDGGNGAASDAVEGVANVLSAKAAGDHLGVDCVAGVGVRGEHLAGDLGVSWLVGAYQTQLVAAEDWNQSEQQQEDGNGEQDDKFTHGDRSRQSSGEATAWLRGGSLRWTRWAVDYRSFIFVERDKASRVLSVAG